MHQQTLCLPVAAWVSVSSVALPPTSLVSGSQCWGRGRTDLWGLSLVGGATTEVGTAGSGSLVLRFSFLRVLTHHAQLLSSAAAGAARGKEDS